ncbi:uncharacterized protein LOC141904338 [Tubulanus polymorphus]|uniref:uncharacterized protein LOC141904338 n=1 Tax=Tubulanus polymorphus TaxID=672921 RepID=UPI003DA47501
MDPIVNTLLLTEAVNLVSTRKVGSVPEIEVDGVPITTSESVKDLGAWLDQGMTMQEHIKRTCKAAYASLYKIGRIRRFLDQNSTIKLVHAFVLSRLDFNHGILYGLPAKTLAPLQRVQNMAARLVRRKRKFDRITPILIELHWLPVQARIEFKILSTVHRCIHGSAPVYLSNLLRRVEGRTRSSTSLALHVPHSKSKYGDRAFSSCAPYLWNSLPISIRATVDEGSFRNALKKYLFLQYFQEIAL